MFTLVVMRLTVSYGCSRCPASWESIILHIGNPENDQNSKFEVRVLLKVCCFPTIVKLKNHKPNHPNSGIGCSSIICWRLWICNYKYSYKIPGSNSFHWSYVKHLKKKYYLFYINPPSLPSFLSSFLPSFPFFCFSV